MHPDDQFSTTSSQWTTTYRKLPKKQPLSVRFLSWAAGAPRGATVMKKRTRDYADDRSQRSYASSRSYFADPDTQLYWVSAPEARSYSSGSSSTSSRRSKKSGGGKHFNGTPMPQQPPPPPGMGFRGPPGGHFSPPPPPMQQGHMPMPMPMHMPMPMPMSMDDGMDDHMSMGGGYHGMAPPPPPPPPGMGGPPGDQPAFFDLTGQNQPGNPFHGGGGDYHSDMSSSGYDSDSVYSGEYH